MFVLMLFEPEASRQHSIHHWISYLQKPSSRFFQVTQKTEQFSILLNEIQNSDLRHLLSGETSCTALVLLLSLSLSLSVMTPFHVCSVRVVVLWSVCLTCATRSIVFVQILFLDLCNAFDRVMSI